MGSIYLKCGCCISRDIYTGLVHSVDICIKHVSPALSEGLETIWEEMGNERKDS
jgi:hypothetical protein